TWWCGPAPATAPATRVGRATPASSGRGASGGGPCAWWGSLADVGPHLGELSDQAVGDAGERRHLAPLLPSLALAAHQAPRHGAVARADEVLHDHVLEAGVVGVESDPPRLVEGLAGVDQVAGEV